MRVWEEGGGAIDRVIPGRAVPAAGLVVALAERLVPSSGEAVDGGGNVLVEAGGC